MRPCLAILSTALLAATTSAFLPLGSEIYHGRNKDACPWQIRRTESSMVYVVPKGMGGDRSEREAEIRRKIAQLKKAGKLQKKQDEFDEQEDDDDDGMTASSMGDRSMDAYQLKITKKLGSAKSKMLGFEGIDEEDDDDGEEEDTMATSRPKREARLGTLPSSMLADEESGMSGYQRPSSSSSTKNKPFIDPSLFDDDDDEETQGADMDEEALIDLVAEKMAEKKRLAQEARDAEMREKAREKLAQLEQERLAASNKATAVNDPQNEQGMLTSGVGGRWTKNESKAEEDFYQPKSGSWGAFPRPRDISKAYGGGRKVGPGYSNEEERLASVEETRAKLQRYRQKMGIEVQSEKDHAVEIEEALSIGHMAMQRGVYSTAVSALEKVTKYCSSNSKVGGKVFLELAMAYEAVGRTEEAIAVYTTLSRCRIEEIKMNAQRLLYGLEAMQFMQNELKSPEYSRKKVRNTFIETTGLGNIASKFDDVYNTAYVDLDSGFYKRLTESVVRSNREARQILLKAIGSGDVTRLRIVQALRSLSRNFDDALQKEIAENTVPETVAVIDGKPILQKRRQDAMASNMRDMDEFVLADSQQMMDNLNGEWRLQLLADKRGDGVKYFNSTNSWQLVDMQSKTFSAQSPSGFSTVQQRGEVEFNEKRRILRRRALQISGGMFQGLFGSTPTGALKAVQTPQQIISVDSILLITRGVPSRQKGSSSYNNDDEKEYFAVWRRVDRGTFSRP